MLVSNYLQSGNPEQNLEVLASFKMTQAFTYCTTEEVHKLTPRAQHSANQIQAVAKGILIG